MAFILLFINCLSFQTPGAPVPSREASIPH